MIYFLIGAGIVVVALCLHYSTETKETNCSPASSGNGSCLPMSEERSCGWKSDWDDEDIISDPAYSSLSCNIFHDDC